MSYIIGAQQSSGAFVFSRQDATPPVLAETYFAVATLATLHVEVPRTAALLATMQAWFRTADQQLSRGTATLGPRDLYEIAELDSLLSSDAGNRVLGDYGARLTAAVTAPGDPAGNLHDWYFAVLTLASQHEVGASVGAAVEMAASRVIGSLSTLAGPNRPLTLALALDAASRAALRLKSDVVRSGWSAIAVTGPNTVRSRNGGDVLTLFYLSLAAIETLPAGYLDRSDIESSLASVARNGAYAAAPGQPASPLATLYAVECRALLHGTDAAKVAR